MASEDCSGNAGLCKASITGGWATYPPVSPSWAALWTPGTPWRTLSLSAFLRLLSPSWFWPQKQNVVQTPDWSQILICFQARSHVSSLEGLSTLAEFQQSLN